MGQGIFTTKKMKLENKSMAKKSLIGLVTVAILGGAGFGVYQFASSHERPSRSPISSQSKPVEHRQEPVWDRTLPKFASSTESNSSMKGKAKNSFKDPAAPKTKKKKTKNIASKKHKKSKHKLASKHKSKKNKKHVVKGHKKAKKSVAQNKKNKKKQSHRPQVATN